MTWQKFLEVAEAHIGPPANLTAGRETARASFPSFDDLLLPGVLIEAIDSRGRSELLQLRNWDGQRWVLLRDYGVTGRIRLNSSADYIFRGGKGFARKVKRILRGQA